jgi:glycosyltransferase involved in cell wall biosynthesis
VPNVITPTESAGSKSDRGALVIHLARGREWRGGERQVFQLVRTLAAGGEWRQVLLTRRGSALARAAAEAALRPVEVPWRTALDPRVVRSTLRQVHETTDSVVVHAHDSHALLLGLVVTRLAGCPFVATRRSTTDPGRMWRHADRVIAISRAVEAALLGGGVEPSRIDVVPSGIDVTALAAARSGGSLETACEVISIGALTQEKGHRLLVEAFARVLSRLPQARLTIAGEGPERSAIEALIRHHRLETRVILAGQLKDPVAHLAQAAVLVQPSLREALGTTVLEAMALGVPVVASKVGGLTELLGNGEGVLVPPGDPDQLAQAIIALVEDPGRREAVRQKAYDRSRHYDIRDMAERCAQVYRSALNQPGR